ncbi:YiiX/YebB-like N1pC/P60 family cysteine hydrolase [Bdellovibrio svalbardensis]|uniref:YiiX/YebB-like N1pC/P60 family cysteine hydrolase n=1 Tax=Bdellovibrio svalbardensis TaxID=2972972 RepID=A0ABT6DGN1_9BACT|nr:YiiX/YebB-like N1pC/P60 family cysteine hydrolase [Bdellovibrio svalbardensis]MDG0815664.1 YiiX/YebB-like N1pC/P60 family cysteine hydrolase [Bdellovibrio svalbardensis]
MKKIALLVFASAFTFANMGCQSPFKPSDSQRKPASTEDLFSGASTVLRDLNDNTVFNAKTCASYINGMTDYLYGATSDYFIPKTPQEIGKMKEQGVGLMKSLFQVRVTLREKYQLFDERNELTPECITKVREGIQYSRITEEYLLEWLVHNKVVDVRTPAILEADPIYTMTNPKFEGFKLQTGDLLVVRGKSYVSAMIARIADEEGNFSHLAIVGEDKKGNQYIVESLIQTGIIITPLEKWRKAQDARVALYRNPDKDLAKRAGQMMYEYSKAGIAKNGEIRYDFGMNDKNYNDGFFCSEVARYAYDKASNGAVIVPKFRSSVTKFKNTDYPASLGVTAKTLFAPYDVEADPRFDFVAEYKYYPLLRQVRMQDAVLQSVYGWMIQKDYNFHFSIPSASKALLGKFLRQFGLVKDVLPKYMPLQTLRTTAQFEAVATTLEKNLYEKEDKYYKEHGYLPTFREFLTINDDYRRKDCQLHKEYQDARNSPFPDDRYRNEVDRSKFHWFFYSKAKSCE